MGRWIVSRMTPRRVFLASVAVGVIDLASPANANAPAGQYDFFNQYSVVIHDMHTDLLWQRGYVGMMTFDQAGAYCQSLSLAPYGSGWRVPSYKELLTLVDEHPHVEVLLGKPEQKAIDENAFYGTPTDAPFWSSSLFAQSTGATLAGYEVWFDDGHVEHFGVATPFYVRCVHD
jgi:hypothetical protein